MLVSNKNLLILAIADILIVNKGFADKNPDKVAARHRGWPAERETAPVLRDNPEANADVIGKAFMEAQSNPGGIAESESVESAGEPGVFGRAITQGGSFANIYQSAVLAYGTQVVPNPVDSDHFAYAAAARQGAGIRALIRMKWHPSRPSQRGRETAVEK